MTSLILPRLKKTWVVFQAPDGCVYLMNRERQLRLAGQPQVKMRLLRLLDGKHTVPEIIYQFGQETPGLSPRDVASAVEALAARDLLEDAAQEVPPGLAAYDLERYARQIDYFSEFERSGVTRYHYQLRLKNSKVILVGLGGMGSWVALGLAGAGVGHLVGFDGDVVELSNLQRQILYRAEHIGQAKAGAAHETIARFNPEIRFDGIPRRVASPDDLQPYLCGADLVLGLATDPPFEIANWIGAACVQARVPYLFATTAIVGPTHVPGRTACHYCQLLDSLETHPLTEAFMTARIQNQPTVFNTSGTQVFQAQCTPALLAIVGGLIVNEAIKQLTGYAEPETYNHIFEIPSRTMRIAELHYRPIARRKHCPICGEPVPAGSRE